MAIPEFVTRPAVTQQYHYPPARPLAPAPTDCSDEDLLQLAMDASRNNEDLWALLSSGAHVQSLCQLIVDLWPARRCALRRVGVAEQQRSLAQGMCVQLHGELAEARRALEIERAAHQATMQRLRETERLARCEAASRYWTEGGHARVSEENKHLRHQLAGTTPVAIQVVLQQDAMENTEVTGAPY